MGRSRTSYRPGQSGNPATQFSSANQPKHDRTLPRMSFKMAMEALSDSADWRKITSDPSVSRDLYERFGNNGLKAIAYVTIGKALQGDMAAARIIQRILG